MSVHLVYVTVHKSSTLYHVIECGRSRPCDSWEWPVMTASVSHGGFVLTHVFVQYVKQTIRHHVHIDLSLKSNA